MIVQRLFFFLFLNKNIRCDPSLEPSRERSQYMLNFYGKIRKIVPDLSQSPQYPCLLREQRLFFDTTAVL